VCRSYRGAGGKRLTDIVSFDVRCSMFALFEVLGSGSAFRRTSNLERRTRNRVYARQGNAEGAAIGARALEGQLTADRLDAAFGQRQPEAGARSRRIALTEEAIEDAIARLVRDAGPGIDDLERRALGRLTDANP